MDNDQVYFGRYQHIPFAQFATLRDVYFLKKATTTGESSIVGRLVNEPYGPKSYMRVNVDHIIGINTLRNDSDFVKSIETINNQK